jgi:hypothetical protein
MAEAYSLETQALLDAADLAIAQSRELVKQHRQVIAECERQLRVQSADFASRREMRKSK